MGRFCLKELGLPRIDGTIMLCVMLGDEEVCLALQTVGLKVYP